MDKKGFHFNFALWMKFAVLIIGLCVADFFIASYVGLRFGDLFFIEGALVFVAGVGIAGGGGNLRRERPSTLMGSPTGHTEFLEEQRKKQISEGIIVAAVGGIRIGISVVY